MMTDKSRKALAETDRLIAYVLHHYTGATTGHDRTKFERDLSSIGDGLRAQIAAISQPGTPAREAMEAAYDALGIVQLEGIAGPTCLEQVGKARDALDVILAEIEGAALTPAGTTTEFKNELGNTIRIIVEGPTSKSTNDLTPLEAQRLNETLTRHFSSHEAGTPKCPRCGSGNVTIDRARKPLADSLICEGCNYVGPITNQNYPTPPEAGTQEPVAGDEPKMPCDFFVGAVRFHKGVKVETVRRAAERWYKAAAEKFTAPASHEAEPQQPVAGWKLVPVIPTFEMMNANCYPNVHETRLNLWNVMLDAAPAAPASHDATRDLASAAGMDIYQFNTGVVRSEDASFRVGVSAPGYGPENGDRLAITFGMETQPSDNFRWTVGHFSPARARVLARHLLDRAEVLEPLASLVRADRATLPPTPHVEYVASRGQSKVEYWVSREEGDRIRAAALASAGREGKCDGQAEA